MLVSFGLVNQVLQSHIKPGFRSDHSYVSIDLQLNPIEKGRGYWKMNTSLLTDIEYVRLIKASITDCISFNRDANILTLWDTIKCVVTGDTIKYSSMKKSERKNK